MNADPRRCLYLHTGTWKTGSTALQGFLNINRERLAAAGISYVLPPNPKTWQGNATSLCGELLGQHVPSARLIELLQMYIADRRVAICSSENFTSFRKAEWAQLLDAAGHLDLNVTTITYVRDVAPYYQSMHAQAFKAGEHYCELAQFCQLNCYATVMDSLRSLLENFGRDRMIVVRYESTREAVDAPLLAPLGLNPEAFDRTMLVKRINRSLTNYEMKILARLIEKTGRQFANDLSNRLLHERPALEPDNALDQALVQGLTERHRQDVQWINETFFDRADTVRVGETGDVTQLGRPSMGETEQAIDRDVADWCINTLASIQDSTIAFVAKKIASIDWGNISNPALPVDFDPIAYLILNVDVLKAGVPPCAHYISAGQNDGPARRWRW